MAADRPKKPRPKRDVTVNIRLDFATVEELEEIADREGRTRSNLIAQVLREWLAGRRGAAQQ